MMITEEIYTLFPKTNPKLEKRSFIRQLQSARLLKSISLKHLLKAVNKPLKQDRKQLVFARVSLILTNCFIASE